MARVEIIVDGRWNGVRVDKIVVGSLAGATGRSGAKHLFDQGLVRVNGHRVVKGRVAAEGEVITVDLPDKTEEAVVSESEAPIDVRLERPDLVVVAKPAGQPTAPLRDGERGTLVNALIARYPEMADVGYGGREPGIVHRLDTDTSGLLIAARSQPVFERLRKALTDGEIDKTYWLACRAEGLAMHGTIELPLASHPKDARKVVACAGEHDKHRSKARQASTSFRVIETVGPWACVEAKAARAGRHQIRAHFAAIEHPLVGDGLYGGDVADLRRQALHACRLSWKGDGPVAGFDAEAALPTDLADWLERARQAART